MGTIEGKNPVVEALKAGRPISKILLDKDIRGHGATEQITGLSKSQGIEVEYVDRQTLDRQSSTGMHQGVIALAAG